MYKLYLFLKSLDCIAIFPGMVANYKYLSEQWKPEHVQ